MRIRSYNIEASGLPSSLSNDDREYIVEAARFLCEQGANRIWLFGSFAQGRQTVRSDFDFAVEGLPGERFFESIGHLLQALPRPVDVVELESCSLLLREQITNHGIMLYG